jgi:hypothetical protein
MNGNYSAWPEEESATRRPDRDTLAPHQLAVDRAVSPKSRAFRLGRPRVGPVVRRGYGRAVRLYPEEPAAGPWTVKPLAEVVASAVGVWPSGRPALVAVDGRSSAGKTTLAAMLCETTDSALVVHTDDIAWRHSVFGWGGLIAHGVLVPARRGETVSYRPPAWDLVGRPGAIEVPTGTRLLIVEGVGAGRQELAAHFDGIIWVQSDLDQALARDQKRVAAGEISAEDYADWMAQERPFQADQQTWARAQLIVCGPVLADLPHGHVMVAAPVPSA